MFYNKAVQRYFCSNIRIVYGGNKEFQYYYNRNRIDFENIHFFIFIANFIGQSVLDIVRSISFQSLFHFE